MTRSTAALLILPFALIPSLLASSLIGCGNDDPADADEDGFTADEDCDDQDANINPAADEICDGQDNDCDSLVDDADNDLDASTTNTFYADADSDGYGNPLAPVQACELPEDSSASAGDCDDGSARVHPDADEVCNDQDDDCNDEIDDDATDATAWYADSDGDGFGDPSVPVRSCDAPDDHVADASDCDDTEATVNPLGTEVCDGLDNDCNVATGEEGMVSWQAGDGSWSDWTTAFDGRDGVPAEIVLDEAGTAWFCDGSYYVNLDIQRDTTLRSVAGDPEAVTLSAGGVGSVLMLDADGLELRVDGLTLAGGDGSISTTFGYDCGGAIRCEADSGLWLSDVVLEGGDVAGYGGGLYGLGCDTTLDAVVVRGNSASLGGGVIVLDGRHDWSAVEVLENLATNTTGGVYLQAYNEPTATGDFTDLWLEGNHSDFYNAAAWIQDASVSWTSTSKPGSGVVGNTVGYDSYGAVFVSSTDLTVGEVDFGTDAGGNDNPGADIMTGVLFAYEAGDAASFTCDGTRCGEPQAVSIGGDVYEEYMDGYLLGDVVLADAWGTIETLYAPVTTTGSCTARLFVASTDSAASNAWELEWMSGGTAVPSSGGVSNDYVGVLAEPGRYYLLGVGVDCTSGYALLEGDLDTPATDAIFGDSIGYSYALDYGSYGTWSSSLTFGHQTVYPAPWSFSFDLTQL